MGSKKLRIALVGSGATGLAFWWGLSGSNAAVELTLFDGLGSLPPKKLEDESQRGYLNTKANQNAFSIPEQLKTTSSLKNEIAGSFVAGGWTSIWGATMLPWHIDAYTSWGIHSAEMHSALNEITTRIPVMGSSDYLSESFQVNSRPSNLRPDSILYVEMLKSFKPSNLCTFGRSRLAISPIASKSEIGCVQCGLCLKGCPYNHIWSAKGSWDQIPIGVDGSSLKRTVGLVKSLTQSPLNQKWSLSFIDTELEVEITEDFDLIVLAAGALSTASILLNSKICKEVLIKDSPLTIVPFFLKNFRKIGGLDPRITLSEVFIVGKSSLSVEEHVYMQAYGGSSEILERILIRFRFLIFIPQKLLFDLVKRIGVAMIFQDDYYGGEISAQVSENKTKIVERKKKSIEGKQRLKMFLRDIGRQGIHFLWPLRYEAGVGEGYHFGASFPMGEKGLVDFGGEFKSAQGLYCVDSSVLPRVSCYPITLTAMANSFRIGKELGKKYEVR